LAQQLVPALAAVHFPNKPAKKQSLNSKWIAMQKIFFNWMLLCQIVLFVLVRLPDPMPDGHINRDVQVLVNNRDVTVDIRMSATDLTWVEVIRMAEARTNKQALQESDTEAFSSESSPGQAQARPIPTDEKEVSQWLQIDANRVVLEQWVASHCRAEWCSANVSPVARIVSRADSSHHWAVTFQLKFQIPTGTDAGTWKWHQTPFADYPGKVRRALKTRGESMIDSSDVSPLVVRAEFELKSADQSSAEREETIWAELRLAQDPGTLSPK
jgi:hypothetical protein